MILQARMKAVYLERNLNAYLESFLKEKYLNAKQVLAGLKSKVAYQNYYFAS